MKIYILTLLSIMLLFCSCNDYLDKDPENKVDVEDVDYSQTENMFQPVSGVYAVTNTKMSSWAMYGLLSIRTDDVNKGSSASDQGDLTYCKNFNYSLIADYWALNTTWKNLYELVQYSNAALISLDKYAEFLTSESDKALNLQYKAEVRFIRAYALFYITRLWGDVPLLLNNDDVMTNLGKSSREDVYNFIITEMDESAANMPALRPNEMSYKGQATKYTALALKAKASADINDWDKVLDATNQIIDSQKFTLFSDYYTYFKKPGRLCDETLFELQFSDLGAGSGTAYTSDAWFAFQGPRNGFEGSKISSGWGFLTPTDKLIQLFNTRNDNIRYKTTLLFAGTTTPEGDVLKPSTSDEGTDKVFNGKAYYPSTDMTEGRTDYGMGNNIRMIRYSDILLLNAEAKVRKGQNGDTPLNLVRNRVGLSNISNATLDQILEERRAELACEWGERFFDLVRTDKAVSTLPGFKTGESEFYPIPQAQKDLNPNL